MKKDQIESETRALELAIARRIRKRRKQNGWTLSDIAKVTGLSKGHLSQIENGERVPPISTLTKIAFALGTHITALISGESATADISPISVGKVEMRLPVVHTESSSKTLYESFGFRKTDRTMDTYVVTIGPQFPPKPMVHRGQEFVYALQGTHEFYYDGQFYKLKSGDAVYFDSDRPHMGRSISRAPAKVLVVYCTGPSKL